MPHLDHVVTPRSYHLGRDDGFFHRVFRRVSLAGALGKHFVEDGRVPFFQVLVFLLVFELGTGGAHLLQLVADGLGRHPELVCHLCQPWPGLGSSCPLCLCQFPLRLCERFHCRGEEVFRLLEGNGVAHITHCLSRLLQSLLASAVRGLGLTTNRLDGAFGLEALLLKFRLHNERWARGAVPWDLPATGRRQQAVAVTMRPDLSAAELVPEPPPLERRAVPAIPIIQEYLDEVWAGLVQTLLVHLPAMI
mmetsp:Transcript_102950/g.290804  ORF Transcript_102950/g.290804 Transcript_102950/m.290804 type:complete len:249 (+) Transcript_102950:5163-5909(+)